jgi:hypothetical protein
LDPLTHPASAQNNLTSGVNGINDSMIFGFKAGSILQIEPNINQWFRLQT